MIAEDDQPPTPGGETRLGTSTAGRPSAGEAPAGRCGPRQASPGHPDGGAKRAAAAVKPGMRGWLHAGMFPLALAGGIVLFALSRSASVAVACAVYAVAALLLFGTSAVYHRGDWGPRGEAVLRRLDHANIFLITAGTYTPLAVLLPGRRQTAPLTLVWAGAAAGIAFRDRRRTDRLAQGPTRMGSG